MFETVSLQDVLENVGFTFKDDFLPHNVFQKLNKQVLQSWDNGEGWCTRVKGPAEAKILPLQTSDNIIKIRSLLDNQIEFHAGGFSYLYHSMHQDNDDAGLIAIIRAAVIEGWKSELTQLIGQWDDTNFSLTAYTPFCFLDMHTDHVSGAGRYKVTLLLYFGNKEAHLKQSNLVFNYRGNKTVISTIPNRSVLFVPSPETNHGIPCNNGETANQFARLAFSGWLL